MKKLKEINFWTTLDIKKSGIVQDGDLWCSKDQHEINIRERVAQLKQEIRYLDSPLFLDRKSFKFFRIKCFQKIDEVFPDLKEEEV